MDEEEREYIGERNSGTTIEKARDECAKEAREKMSKERFLELADLATEIVKLCKESKLKSRERCIVREMAERYYDLA